MRRMFALLTILLALVAVAVPSVAVGSRGLVAQPAPLLLLTDAGSYVRAPCLLANGNRVMICRPDVGVLPSFAFLMPPPAMPFAPSFTDPLPRELVMEPGLPPPRSA